MKPLLGDFFEQQIYPRTGLVAMGLVGLLFLIVFGDYFFGKYLYLFKDMGSDSLNVYLPSRIHFADLLREEGFVGWSFKQGMGQGISGMGITSPFMWLFYLAGSTGSPYIVIYCIFIEIMVGGWIFNRYLKVMDLSPYTVILGTVLFAFSGFVFGTTGFWNYWQMVLGGVLFLYASELMIRKNVWWPFALAVFLLAGPRLILFVIFLVAYTIFRVVDLNGWDFKKIALTGVKMGALGALGVLMSSITFAPTVNKILHSSRIAGGAASFSSLLNKPIFGFGTEDMENGTAILRAFSSEIMGSMRDYKAFWNYLEAPFYYISTFGLLLIPLIFSHLSKQRKILFGAFAGFWLVPMIFPFFRHAFFLYAVPHYRGFSLLVTLAMLFFAMNALSKVDKKNRIHLPTLLGTLVVLMTLLNLPYFSDKSTSPIDGNIHALANIFLVINSGFIFLLSKPKYKYLAQALIILSVMIEYGYTYHKSTHERDMVSVKEWKSRTGFNDYTHEAIAYIKENEKAPFYRVHQFYNSSPAMHASLNDAFVFNYYSTPSYQSHNHPNYLEFLRKVKIARENNVTDAKWAPGLRGRFALELISNVKYNITKKGSNFKHPDALVTKVAEFENVTVNKMNLHLPFGFTYDNYMLYDDFLELGQTKIDKALLKSFVVFKDDLEKVKSFGQITPSQINKANPTIEALTADVNALKRDTFVITSFKQDHIEGNILIQNEKLLFFSFPFDKGWSATVDGAPVELLQVNVGLTGLVLKPGKHEIVLHYQLPYFNLAILLSILGLLIFLGLFVWEWRSAKKNN